MKEPKFWDDAAEVACGMIFIISGDLETDVDTLRGAFDNFVNVHFDGDGESKDSAATTRMWMIIGSHAVRLSKQRNNPLTEEEVVKTLIRKQRDYGHENIRRFGRRGLLIRCHDKIARLENLCGADFEPNNESIEDTLLDIVGYSAIGIMWEQQDFLLPLAPPTNPEELLA